MAQTSSYSNAYTLGSINLSGARSVTSDRVETYDFTLVPGFSGLHNTGVGVDALATGHGFAVSDVIDVHWDDVTTGFHMSRRGLTVDVSNANDIEFDETPAGEGDALPADDYVVIVAKQVTLTTMSVVGNNIQLIAANSDTKSVIDIRQNASTSKQLAKLVADDVWAWVPRNGFTNPFAAVTVTIIRCSNATVVVGRLSFAVAYDLP